VVVDDVIAAIRQELKRLGATAGDVGPIDGIRVLDWADGYAQLVGARHKTPAFHWYDKAARFTSGSPPSPTGSPRRRSAPSSHADPGPTRVRLIA
jgi:hypothetical protein